MPSLNKAMILGHVGREPEMRFTASGQCLTTFSIATSHRYQQDGEWKEETTWHNIVASGSLAERRNERLNKGSLLYVEGRLSTRSWEKDGVRQYRTDIVASQVLFLERNPRPEPSQRRGYGEEETDEMPS